MLGRLTVQGKERFYAFFGLSKEENMPMYFWRSSRCAPIFHLHPLQNNKYTLHSEKPRAFSMVKFKDGTEGVAG